ncbi:MAG: glycosyltransferase [Pseudomonadota bacterium]
MNEFDEESRRIFGHCRFSYFGRTDTGRDVESLDHAKRLLWNKERMAVRFHLFEQITLPSIEYQTDVDFEFVITTSNEMPDVYQARLDDAVAHLSNVRVLRTSETQIGNALRDVMYEASESSINGSVHFRLDDDDALCVQYIERLRVAAAALQPRTMVTFSTGVLGHTEGDRAIHRTFEQHSIAIGLALVNAPGDLRTPFQIQHKAYGNSNPVFSDPTFTAFHYTRHTTNNTNGYEKVIHKDGGTVDIVSRNSLRAHPEFAEGAVTTDAAEARIAEAFPYTTGPQLRDVIKATLVPEELM